MKLHFFLLDSLLEPLQNPNSGLASTHWHASLGGISNAAPEICQIQEEHDQLGFDPVIPGEKIQQA